MSIFIPMLTNDPEILSIIRARKHWQLLQGYHGGMFSPEKDKLFALTYVQLSEANYTDFEYHFLSSGAHTVVGVTGDTYKYAADGSYTSRSTEECVSEGIYSAFSIAFHGVLLEDGWYIHHDLCFFGRDIDEAAAIAYRQKSTARADFWHTGLFRIGYSTLLTSHPVPEQYREFNHLPLLAMFLKQEKKEAVNRAYIRYMNETLVFPFFEQLRIQFPEEYIGLAPLYGEDYTLIFPNSREFFLVVAMVKNAREEYAIRYFLYHPQDKTFYHWTYLQPRITDFSYHYGTEVEAGIRALIDDHPLELHSSTTMDHAPFWDNYVFKQENGAYLYLSKVFQ